MSIWLFRAGRNGEFEAKFLADKRIYLTWDELTIDLSEYKDRDKLLQKLTEMYDSEKTNTIRNWGRTNRILLFITLIYLTLHLR